MGLCQKGLTFSSVLLAIITGENTPPGASHSLLDRGPLSTCFHCGRSGRSFGGSVNTGGAYVAMGIRYLKGTCRLELIGSDKAVGYH